MKIGKKKNIIILIVVVIIIWGIVLSNVISYVHSTHENYDENIQSNNDSVSKSGRQPAHFEETEFITLKRDPFGLPRLHTLSKLKPNPKIVHEKNEKSPPVQIDYKIAGTIVNDTEKLLVLEDITNKTTVFLKEGELYKGIKIDSILTESITLTQGSATKKIHIPR
jgi:hypothetical protein